MKYFSITLRIKILRAWLSDRSIRTKLIGLFVFIKVLPLLMLALLAWQTYQMLSEQISRHASEVVEDMRTTIQKVGDQVTKDTTRQLDLRSQEAIERLTTETAERLADFLYARDADIHTAALLKPGEAVYRSFLQNRLRGVIDQGRWRLADDGQSWIPQFKEKSLPDMHMVKPLLLDNQKDFHYRPPKQNKNAVLRPLYLEMTFIDLNGQEQVKVTTGNLLDPKRRNVADPANTYVKAETYFRELNALPPDGIYVSNVIGPYLPSPIIGTYTPASAAAAGIPYQPEQGAYAGKENPLGRRFQGLIRWVTPVLRNGKKIGYVTLALDHTHIMEFSNHLVPTDERFTLIPDASSGNYAYIWGYQGNSIAHPRNYFITGYDPATGKPVPPWLEKTMYERWRTSGLAIDTFLKQQPTYREQSLNKKPSSEQMRLGQLGLDCRYLNFAPQCAGWRDLTHDGGSGSLVIFWSGLWKLSTAAAIPYFTGQYGRTAAGFGWVTIGANVDEFHKSATATKSQIDNLLAIRDQSLQQRLISLKAQMAHALGSMTLLLSISTAVMLVIVIAIAIWMASMLTSRIVALAVGLERFQQGDYDHRLMPRSHDELGQLARAYNAMANTIRDAFAALHRANEELDQRVEARTAELNEANAALKCLATTDELTGAYNRRHFVEIGKREIARWERLREPLALIMLDIDHFKEINDRYGHAMGDKALQQVAAICLQNLREYDCFARIGGEEFVVLQPYTDFAAATEVAERIRCAVEAQVFTMAEKNIKITLSAGIAVLKHSHLSLEALLAAADEAMYRAKASGRNKVAV
jgi:diguanylate cyclase (GGDEF)-like protein